MEGVGGLDVESSTSTVSVAHAVNLMFKNIQIPESIVGIRVLIVWHHLHVGSNCERCLQHHHTLHSKNNIWDN